LSIDEETARTLLMVVGLALAGAVTFGVAGHRRGRRGVIVTLLAIAIVLGLDAVAFLTDFEDADGAIDCWPHCTALQESVRWSSALGPPLFVVLTAALLARTVADAIRRG